MPSPFPGMNPYLEQPSVWEDFHTAFAAQIRDVLAAQVRPNFMVKLEERVFIHEPSGGERRKQLGRPDIALLEDVDIERHAFVEIHDRQNRELVTMIEIFSPSNKRYGPYRDQHIMKRTSLMFSTASLVEIDLLRGGPRFPLNDLPPSDYFVAIYRKPLLPQVEAWPIGIRNQLPVIPIPLKGEFPDASLDLQAVLHRVYDAAGYEDYIYESSPEPPLEGPDLAWAQSILGTKNSAS
ncbi:DUF4058 family protein [Pirellulaceae bacterium SH449]